jgi:hypothetical protein
MICINANCEACEWCGEAQAYEVLVNGLRIGVCGYHYDKCQPVNENERELSLLR